MMSAIYTYVLNLIFSFLFWGTLAQQPPTLARTQATYRSAMGFRERAINSRLSAIENLYFAVMIAVVRRQISVYRV